MTRMDITISDDGEQDPEPLWKRLKETEREIAKQEGREPEGWYWIEGMDKPAEIEWGEK